MNVLLVEDESRVADFIRRGLKVEGWNVEHVSTGEDALMLIGENDYDVVVLDLMLPGISGQDVCRKLRARKIHIPILMLSALDAVDERVVGLQLGADDYLPKPFDFDELVARMKALVRRDKDFKQASNTSILAYEGLEFDTSSVVISVDGETIDMTSKERELLRLFLVNAGKALGRERILSAVWGATEDPLTNVVDVYVSRLRKKLGNYGSLLKTVRGSGYRFGR